MSEVWKPVVGFEGLYEVSDHGRVRSFHKGRSKLIASGPHRGGYVAYHLYENGACKSTTAHALVAEAFLGPRPDGQQVCHNDGDKQNNRPSNIRYDTPTKNNADKKKHGTHREGERSPVAKLTARAVLAIRAARGRSQQDLADEYGCTFSNISAIQLRKSWRHV